MRDPTDGAQEAFNAALGDAQGTSRPMPPLVAFPFNVLEAIGRVGFYATWHLLYFVACAFRAFTGFLFVAGVVMLPVSLGVFVNPNAAPMPWWFFLCSAFGMFAIAIGYNLFLDWFAPPGAEDPFNRYRPKANRRA
ncbi:MAG: hypothetical protein AB7S46_09440 [Flavobacteriaceae bacterium]